jgi:hypothetical protein
MWWTQSAMVKRTAEAFLLMTVPIGPDTVAWNLHLGKVRLPLSPRRAGAVL